METRLIFIHTLSPLHAGTGQGTGVIDLPIAREKPTGIPYIPGSSLKGVLRDATGAEHTRTVLFGAARGDVTADAAAGALQLTDLRLVLFPVRSIAGIFAWVTSPYVLRRFARDARDTGHHVPEVPRIADLGHILTSTGSGLIVDEQRHVYLEDLDLLAQMETVPAVNAWGAWLANLLFPTETAFLTERFVVVHDDVLSFLLATATEITARIKLREDAKTVQQGGLWYEEALPTETILAGLAIANAHATMNVATMFAELRTLTAERAVQIGGKASAGRGLSRVILTDGGAHGHS